MYALNESNQQAGYTPVAAASIPAPVPGAEDPRYRCLCGLMHVYTGVLAVAIFEGLFFVVFTVACFTGLLGEGVNGTGVFIIISLPAFIVCGFMIVAVKKKKRGFLIPHLSLQVLLIFACVVSSVIYLIRIADASEDEHGIKIYTVATIMCVVFSVLELWFLYVIWLAYKCLGHW